MERIRNERAVRMLLEVPLWRALAAYRLLTMVYTIVLFCYERHRYERVWLGAVYLAVLAVWTVATLPRVSGVARCTRTFLVCDLSLALAGILMTPLADEQARGADVTTLPSIWTAGAVLAFALKGGWRPACLASTLVAVADIVERAHASKDTIHNVVLVWVASIGIGYVVEVARASERTLARALEIEAATREREKLARDIHDSVLQVLAMVQRRGTALGGEAAELGRMAGEQEIALRTLVTSGLLPHPPTAPDATAPRPSTTPAPAPGPATGPDLDLDPGLESPMGTRAVPHAPGTPEASLPAARTATGGAMEAAEPGPAAPELAEPGPAGPEPAGLAGAAGAAGAAGSAEAAGTGSAAGAGGLADAPAAVRHESPGGPGEPAPALRAARGLRAAEEGAVDLRMLLAPYASARVTLAEPGVPVLLPAAAAAEVAAAVGAALDNVREHAGAGTGAWILVEDEPEGVTVTVRDDGPGIPEGRLARAEGEGRLGVAQSIRGRLRDLGGTADLVSVPGQGTEVELRVPRRGRGKAARGRRT